MSTLLVFGYTSAPQGQPGANPVQYAYLADGEAFDPSTDPNYGKALIADCSGNVNGDPLAWRSIDGLPFKPAAGVRTTVTLRARYWPVPVSGWFRDPQLPSVVQAGQSIQVSAAEAAILLMAGLAH